MKRKVFNTVSILFGLLLLNGGLNKFLNYMPIPNDLPEAMMKDFAAFTEISWLMPLVAVAEIIGGVFVMIPRTRALGALIIFPVAVGILLTNIFVDPSGLIIALVLWAVLLWIIFENYKKYKALL